MSPAVPRFQHLFIVGVGHSGSNLLSRLLSRHPRIACVGETAWVDYALEQETLCTCGSCYEECAYWGPLLPRLAGLAYDYRRFTPELFEELRQASGKDVIVDNSKTRVWRMARRWKGVGFLFLLRDSRGVLASGLRKPQADLDHLLRRHEKWVRRLARFARRRAPETLVVRYEDLARDPRATLARVTDFLALPFDGGMLQPSDEPYHFMYCKKTGALDRGEAIRLDERWRDELSSADLERIERRMRSIALYGELYADA